MKNFKKRLLAFTLAELLIMFLIIGVIASVTIAGYKAKTNLARKHMYYAAFKNLKAGVGELLAEGFDDDSNPVTPNLKQLPNEWTNVGKTGLCDRLSQVFNTVGNYTCTQSNSTISFATSNGMEYAGVVNYTTPRSFSIAINSTEKSTKAEYQPFNISLEGVVEPLHCTTYSHPLSSANSICAGDSTNYLSASVKYIDASGVLNLPVKNVSYREATCKAGAATVSSNYCTASPAYLKLAACDTYSCQVVINKP